MDWGSLASSFASSAGSNLALGSWDGGWSTYSSGQSKLKDALRRQLWAQQELETWQAKNLPKLQREGLEAAGYNPLLAIGGTNFVHGGSLSGSFPDSSGSGGRGVDLLGAMQQAADIKLTEAQTDKVEKEVGVNAWRPVNISRSEAEHFGANLLGKLGINLGTNKSASFTLFYNPITGQLQNPANAEVIAPAGGSSAQELHDNLDAIRILDRKGRGLVIDVTGPPQSDPEKLRLMRNGFSPSK